MFNQNQDYASTQLVGSFSVEKDRDFRDGISNLLESFANNYRIDPVDGIMSILKNETLNEAYKGQLLDDVLNENYGDPYMDLLPSKVEQLYENTRTELLEGYMGQMNPIVGLSLPILKKNFLSCQAKDIVMTEVPDKPYIRMQYERDFLKDKEGNRYYIPEIFYNNEHIAVSEKGRGKAVTDKWFGGTGTEVEEGTLTKTSEAIRIQDLDVLGLSGGSLQTRDTLGADFGIVAVKVVVGSEVREVAVNITPKLGDGNVITGNISVRTEPGDVVRDLIAGQVDAYYGKVSITCTGGKVVAVKFGGHLSNENNVDSLEVDQERETMDWRIPEGQRFNTGITIEKIKDSKALLNKDITAEYISKMSTVATQFEDSSVFKFLDDSFEKWEGKKDLPYGYEGGFVEVAEFNCQVPSGVFAKQSDYIATELKFTVNRLVRALKDKLKTTDIIVVAYGNPANIDLLQEDVNWVIDDGQKIGGVELEQRFGVTTVNGTRLHIVSSLKVAQDKGIRFLIMPTTKDHITFKHLKYSFNIENSYRNPITPLTPNIMCTSRYLTKEVLPIQGKVELTNNDFGIRKY